MAQCACESPGWQKTKFSDGAWLLLAESGCGDKAPDAVFAGNEEIKMSFTENNRIEYKEKLTDNLEKYVVGFVNSKGGEIYIGIRDDGSVAGVHNPDEIQLKIKDKLINNIRPSILGLFDIVAEKRDGKTIIKISLSGGMEMPYYIKQKGRSESGCFMRIGSSTQPLTEQMITDLMSKRHPISLARMPSLHQDLTFKQLRMYYAENNKPLNENLAQTLDFYTPEKKYNHVAYLFADNNNVSIRLGKYAGKDKLDLIGTEEYGNCCFVKAMQKIIDRFEIENITQSQKRGLKTRLDKKLVDKDVLHEVIINAFAHNDYSRGDTPIFEIFSDHFTITSFGGLVEGLSLEKFFNGISMPRNREIVRIFKDLEYMEQIGSGIPKIISKYGKDSVSIDGAVMQILLPFDFLGNEDAAYSAAGQKTSLKTSLKTDLKTDLKILNAIRRNPAVSTIELSEILNLSISGIKWNLNKLKKDGLIRRAGAKKGGYWEMINGRVKSGE